MERTAKAHWSGTLKEGKGSITTNSGILKNTNYSFETRFGEDEKGTNPEELLAAAHAACFTMEVGFLITKKGLKASSLDTLASVSMEGLVINSVHLSITGSVPGMNADDFKAISKKAGKNCLISKILKIPIQVEANLVAAKI